MLNTTCSSNIIHTQCTFVIFTSNIMSHDSCVYFGKTLCRLTGRSKNGKAYTAHYGDIICLPNDWICISFYW